MPRKKTFHNSFSFKRYSNLLYSRNNMYFEMKITEEDFCLYNNTIVYYIYMVQVSVTICMNRYNNCRQVSVSIYIYHT